MNVEIAWKHLLSQFDSLISSGDNSVDGTNFYTVSISLNTQKTED